MKNFLIDEHKIILNIGAGKLFPVGFKEATRDPYFMKHFLIQLDPMYFSHETPAVMEFRYTNWLNNYESMTSKCAYDAFEFIERTHMFFDHISVYRFLEHISFTKIIYFIYLLSTITVKGALIDVIVPNYETLAEMIIKDDFPGDEDFEEHNIYLTTELLNVPEDPHASIWTPDRMKYFWELEGRFELKEIINNYDFDGRDIYIRAILERI